MTERLLYTLALLAIGAALYTSIRPLTHHAGSSSASVAGLTAAVRLPPAASESQRPTTMSSLVLNNGIAIPRLGLGTYLASGSDCKNGVRAALRAGIRHIDTASLYRNEAQVGEAIREEGVPRYEVFITSKVAPFQQGASKARKSVASSLANLQTEYLDLCLIHWPGCTRVESASPENARLRHETWRVLEDEYAKGRCKAIGVSNFQERHLSQLIDIAEVKPMVNQIEVHPRLPQHQLRAACEKLGIAVEAYSPFGAEGAELLRHKTVLAVSQAAKKPPAQVLIQWSIQHGNIVLAKSVQEKHVREFGATDTVFELDGDSLKALDAMEDGHRYLWDPSDVA